MRSKLRAGTPIIALVFIGIAALFIASCTTDEVEIPDLTGPSGARLFITIEASPDKIFLKRPNQNPDRSTITIQLKNQLGQPVPNAQIALRITNSAGSEVGIGSLDDTLVRTDSGGFARVTYTAPSSAEQPANVTVFIRAILTDPAFPFEVVTSHPLDLELSRPVDCVAGPGAPTVNFTVTPATPAEDQQVCFDAQSSVDADGTIVSFTWSFGDGGTASGVFVCHTFTNNGSFPVTLFVVDNDANCVSLTRLVVVGEGNVPTCVISISPTTGITTDTLVRFDASQSEDPDGNIVSFRWDFGDGQSATGEQVTHQFNNDGTFTVTLTVRDNSGNETVCTTTVTVGEGEPTCSFTIDPDPAAVNEDITLDASASTDPEGETLTFAWDFDNDGVFDDATGEVVTTSFSTPGVKIIRLQVTDPEGNQTVCTDTVTIGNTNPVCESFTASDTSIEPGDAIDFTVVASDPDGDPITVTFVTPGGTPGGSVDSAPPFQQLGTVYNSAGEFTANATVEDDQGGSDDCPELTITVEEPPAVVPNVTINNTSVIEGNAGVTSLIFTVSLSEPTTENVVVNYTTADGTATVLDADYIAETSFITITPGNTTGQIDITVNGDVNIEPDETMAVNLTSATGGTITDNQGIGTILNDD